MKKRIFIFLGLLSGLLTIAQSIFIIVFDFTGIKLLLGIIGTTSMMLIALAMYLRLKKH